VPPVDGQFFAVTLSPSIEAVEGKCSPTEGCGRHRLGSPSKRHAARWIELIKNANQVASRVLILRVSV
jgi:hypothetical protein